MKRWQTSRCLGILMILFAGTMSAQTGQNQELLRHILDESVTSWDQSTGKSLEITDSVKISDVSHPLRNIKLKTRIYRDLERIWYEVLEVSHDTAQETPQVSAWAGLADRAGKPQWEVDTSDWIFGVIDAYYHPEARFIISHASVNEAYRRDQVAVLNAMGEVLYMTPMPPALLVNPGGSVIACFYPEDASVKPTQWRLRYRNLDTDQEWDLHLYEKNPKPLMVHPGNHGIFYSDKDTLHYLDSGGKTVWKTTIAGLESGWINSSDGEIFQVLSAAGTFSVLGKKAEKVLYTRQLNPEEMSLIGHLHGIQGSAYSYAFSLIKPGIYGLRFYDAYLNLLQETRVECSSSDHVTFFYLEGSGEVAGYIGNKRFMSLKVKP